MGSDGRFTLRESYVATTAPGTGQCGLPSKVIQFSEYPPSVCWRSPGSMAATSYVISDLTVLLVLSTITTGSDKRRTAIDDFKDYSMVARGLMCVKHISWYASSVYQDAPN